MQTGNEQCPICRSSKFVSRVRQYTYGLKHITWRMQLGMGLFIEDMPVYMCTLYCIERDDNLLDNSQDWMWRRWRIVLGSPWADFICQDWHSSATKYK